MPDRTSPGQDSHATVAPQDGPAHYRLLEPGDEDGVIRVYDASFDRWPPFAIPVPQRQFLGWFLEPHQTFQAYTGVGIVGQTVAAAHCSIRRPIRVQGVDRDGFVGGLGVGVDPAFRRRGIYAGMRYWRAEHLSAEVHCRFTQTEAHRRVQLRAGRTVAPLGNRLSLFLRILHPRRAAEGQRWPLLRAAGYAALRLRGALRARPARATGGVVIGRLDAFDEARFAPFWERAAAAWDFIPVRTSEFLNWRWCDPRTGPFTVLAATEGDALLGYIVLHAEGARGYIPDMLVLPDRDDVARALIDEGVRALDEAGVGGVECWMMARHPYADVLRRGGFARLRRRSAELTRKLKVESRTHPERLTFLADPHAKMHIVQADSDLI